MLFSFISMNSIILLLALVATSAPCHYHQAFSSHTSRHAFIAAAPTSKKFQRSDVELFTVRQKKQTDTPVSEMIDSNLFDKERGALGRRDWIRDMIVFGSNSIAASAHANTASTSLSSSSASYTLSNVPAICDATVESYRKGSNTIHIIGTAHVSSVSAQLAGTAVKEIKPAAVFVELDPQRINRAFRGGRIAQAVNIVFFEESKGQVTVRMTTIFPQNTLIERKSKGLLQAFDKFRVQNPIQEMYEGLEAQGITPGEEFINAVEEGVQNNSIIILGDRPMDITLKRLAKALIFDTDLKKLFEADKIITNKMKDRIPELQEWEKQMEKSGQQTKELTPEQFSLFVERLKTKETTVALMNEVEKAAPALYAALVGERDIFMARGMDAVASALLPALISSGVGLSSSSQVMISVVGLGHIQGIGRELAALGWSKFTPANCRQ